MSHSGQLLRTVNPTTPVYAGSNPAAPSFFGVRLFETAPFLVLILLVAIHLFACKAELFGWLWHGRFLSFASGISFAYVFVDLLPALEKRQPVLKEAFHGVIPYLDLHAYVMALFGVLFYYGLHTQTPSLRNFWLSLSGYLLFNFLVGASLSDGTSPDIQPLYLFAIAMGMHYFIHDHMASLSYPNLYQAKVRFYLIGALFAGYFIGGVIHIPETVEAILVSFVAGGMILNALGYELPKREQIGYAFFVLGSLSYTALLLR